MTAQELQSLLEEVRTGKTGTTDAARRLTDAMSAAPFDDLGFARVDTHRHVRQGFPEVIFGQGKTSEQICGIFEKLIARSPYVLITRTNKDVYGDIRNIFTDAEWHESARLIRVLRDKTSPIQIAKIV